MSSKLTPDILQKQSEFELLVKVPHSKLKEFVIGQIRQEMKLIRSYSLYQLIMIVLLLSTLIKSVVLSSRGMPNPLINVGWGAFFSFTVLVVIHELLHALAYLLTGSRKLYFGAIWSKFIFYVLADQQVVGARAFRVVANAPLVVVKVACVVGLVLYWNHAFAYFIMTVMCLHSLFCAGDMAMMAFYRHHGDKEIFNYDDLSQKMTYFYFRKKNRK